MADNYALWESPDLLLDGQTLYYGIVSRWTRNHGFITTIGPSNADHANGIFGHSSQVNWQDRRKKITLRPGMQVRFRVRMSDYQKPEAFDISAPDGRPLDFHRRFGDVDPYDRVVFGAGKIYHGVIKFFDSRQLYGKLIMDEVERPEVENNDPADRFKPDRIFFKAVDALGDTFPFQIKRGRRCTFKLYYSEKYGWGAFEVMDGSRKPWPSYKDLKQTRKNSKKSESRTTNGYTSGPMPRRRDRTRPTYKRVAPNPRRRDVWMATVRPSYL